MNGWVAAWQFARFARWALWIGYVGYSIYFMSDRAPHLTQFGHLNHSAEIFVFGLPMAAVTAGLLELMFRERVTGVSAGLKR